MQTFRFTFKQFRCLRLVAGVLIGLAICAGSAEAQVEEIFEVTKIDDTDDGMCDADCSLREAIVAANASMADTKTITFSVPDDETISLSSNLPDIGAGVTIDGSTAENLTVDGSGVTRIFRIGADTTTVRDLGLEGAQLEIANGASLSFDVSDEQQFDEVITDAGGIIKEGDGALTLRGTNDYTGGTLVSAGTLIGDTTSLQRSITNNALVVFDQDDVGTYAGAMSGTGAVEKTGTGEVEFTGVNTYTGGTTISDGVLRGDTGSLQGDITVEAAGEVIFDDDDDGTYAGEISGTGAVQKTGTGEVEFTGVNTYTGGTTVSDGVLRGGTASLQGDITVETNGTVIFDHSNDGTYAGVISGLGNVTKSGSGTLSLSGMNTFTGLTSITGGRLDVDGELTGKVAVDASTVLGGTGMILGLVTVEGTVAPGNSIDPIGELTVASVDFTSDSVFEVDVTDLGMGDGNSDHLVVMDTATLANASVLISPGAGFYATEVEVTILTADTIDGDFSENGQNFAFLEISHEIVDDMSVVLTIKRNDEALDKFAETPNQSTIVAALEDALAMGTDPDIVTVFESLQVLTVDEVSSALDSMTGETLTQFATTRLATAERFGRSLDARIRDHQWGSNDALIAAGTGMEEASDLSADRLGSEGKAIFGVAMLGVGPMGAPSVGTDAKEGSRFRTWIDGSGIYGDVDGNPNESGFDYTVWGGSLGADVLLAEHWVLGLAGGYANTDLDFSSRPGEGEVDTYQGALYAGYVDPRFHVGVSGRYAYNEMDGKRKIRFGALNRDASADLDGYDYGARFEGGLNLLDIGGIVFQPTASVNYNHLTQDDVTEEGALSLNLATEDFDLDSLVMGVGMRIRGRWEIEPDFWIVPELHGRWLHEFLDTDRFIEARLVSAPIGASSFQIQGVELPRDSGSVGLSWSVITDSDWSIVGSYDIVLNKDLMQHIGSVTMSFAW